MEMVKSRMPIKSVLDFTQNNMIVKLINFFWNFFHAFP